MSKILIVEDDPTVAAFVSTILLGAGYACLVAPDAEKARALLESEPGIALLILDQHLGETSDNGLALLCAIRQMPKHHAIPVIVCTGDSRTVIVTAFLGQRIAAFIKKPFRPERMLSEVEHALGRTGNAIPAPPSSMPVQR